MVAVSTHDVVNAVNIVNVVNMFCTLGDVLRGIRHGQLTVIGQSATLNLNRRPEGDPRREFEGDGEYLMVQASRLGPRPILLKDMRQRQA